MAVDTELPAKSDDSGGYRIFCDRFRLWILALGTLCLTAIFSNVVSVNMTLICMDPDNDAIGAVDASNGTILGHPGNPVHRYSEYEKTYIQWSVSVASAVATFPLSYICTRYGARLPFFVSGLVSAVATALIPAAVERGLAAFLLARIFQGLSYACDFAVIGVLCGRWSPLSEYAVFIAASTCFTPIASFLTSAVSGVICETSWLGWPYVHYFHALATLILFAVWFALYDDQPARSRFVTRRELDTIHRGKTDAHIRHERFVPYKAILKSPVVWVVWFNTFVALSCEMFTIIYAPVFMKRVLGFGVEATGLFAGLVVAAKLPFKLFCGIFSDKFQCVRERYKLLIFNTVATCVSATVFLGLVFAPARPAAFAVALFALSETSSSANCGGFYKCGALVARQYAEFVLACTQFAKSIALFVVPALVAAFVRDETNAQQWHIVFLIISVALYAANFTFCAFATDEPCAFTRITAKSDRNDQRSEL